MMGFVGADADQLEALAARVESRAQALRVIVASSSAALMTAAWTGAKIDAIRHEWRSRTVPFLARLTAQLEQEGRDLRRHAAQQRETSAAVVRAPATLSQRYSETREGGKDGVHIQKIRCDDGVIRYVVYIDGTDPNVLVGPRGILTNAGAYVGDPTNASQVSVLAAMLATIPLGSEVQLVGYSQGGLVANNIGQMGWYRVTSVVTYGTPEQIDLNPWAGPPVLRVRDDGDRIGMIGTPGEIVNDVIDALMPGDDRDGRLRIATPGTNTDAFGTHTDPRTYREGTDGLDGRARMSPEGNAVMEDQKRYQGVVIEDYGRND